jgi:signal transduction histidine kinase/ligand-binding sensor domain-containing protein/CheY-like chemotaxis protein
MRFRNLTTDMGLSNGDVFCFEQDYEGFIWIGTADGLNKFDGTYFSVFKYHQNDSNSLPSGYINIVYEDRYNTLWIGTVNGLCIYNRDMNNFKRINCISENGSRVIFHVYAIFEDSYNNLWIGSTAGIHRLDRQNYVLNECFNKQCDREIISNCNDICQDKTGNLWFAMDNEIYGGLIKYNPETGEFKKYTRNSPDLRLKENTITCLMADNVNNIWIGYKSKGVDIIGPNHKIIQTLRHIPGQVNSLSIDAITSIIQKDDNTILIGTNGGGIDEYDTEKGIFYHYTNSASDYSLLSNNVQKIFIDRNGILWAGCWGGGVSIFDERFNRFELYKEVIGSSNTLSGTSVTSFAEDKTGNIWISTDGGGISLFNPKKKTFTHFRNDNRNPHLLTNNKVLALQTDEKSGLWVGMWQGGLNYYQIKDNQLVLLKKYGYLNQNDLSSNCVFKICYCKTTKELWIGNYLTGVYKYDPVRETFIPFALPVESPAYNTIRNIFCDSRSDKWFATDYNGLIWYSNNTGKFEKFITSNTDSGSICRNSVSVIFEDSKKRIWVGVDECGLNLFNRETRLFKQYTIEDGLPDNTVVGILEDNKGNLWLSTHNGISKGIFIDSSLYNPKIEFKNYTVQDGLQGKVFNRWSYYHSSSTGEMYFGGLHGFNMFNPDSLKENTIIPPVYLTDFLLFNEPVKIGEKGSPLKKHISQTRKLILNHKQNFFTFRYVALNYIHSEKNQYAYILEGFDKDWNNAGNKREATYTNISPGEYIFRVKASNNDGIWNDKGVSIKVVILPAWWQTLWFRIPAVLLILFLIFRFYYTRISSFRDNQKMLEDMVLRRTKELNDINIALINKQKEVNLQKEELEKQKNSLQKVNEILIDQQNKIIEQNKELFDHRNRLEAIVSERTQELENARKKAEESDRLKSAFLANMSHEIRTPMNAIVGFSSLLNDPEISAKEKDEFIKIIQANSESLLMLINDILDLSMIEANQMKIRHEPFLLNELIDQVYSDFSLYEKNPKLKLIKNNQLDEENLTLNTDKFRLKQILTNFMSNACKFTDSGYVEIGAIKENDDLNIYVKDTGMGIAQDDLEHLFERFRKLSNEKSQAFRGVGLGLAISKRVAELLGGKIIVSSELEKGSVFTFSIPYNYVVSIKEETLLADNQITDEINWTGKNILIVEDEETNYYYLKKILERTNAFTFWAKNGLDALNYIKSGEHADLILMDIKMPVMDGIEALKIIKQIKPNQIIIAQTAYARPEDEAVMRNTGFNDYIAKPISSHDLLILLKKYLQSK